MSETYKRNGTHWNRDDQLILARMLSMPGIPVCCGILGVLLTDNKTCYIPKQAQQLNVTTTWWIYWIQAPHWDGKLLHCRIMYRHLTTSSWGIPVISVETFSLPYQRNETLQCASVSCWTHSRSFQLFSISFDMNLWTICSTLEWNCFSNAKFATFLVIP